MWGVSRWTARFLLLVMLAPAFGPLAMAQCAQPGAMHCMRQPVSERLTHPAMPCHHAMAQAEPPQPESSEAALQASNDGNCCHSHCCCGATTSEWAHPAANLLSFVSLLIEPALPAPGAVLRSSSVLRRDSARAPPRS
ncbi:MAG: hypothetical protein LAO23_20795 [Acidobacteriia bacterium]|nr:hypothetical protein [Terriglobia bacterium]